MSEFNFEEDTAAGQLERYQKQLDADGVMVGVSRQALDEVLTELNTRSTITVDEAVDAINALPYDDAVKYIKKHKAIKALRKLGEKA